MIVKLHHLWQLYQVLSKQTGAMPVAAKLTNLELPAKERHALRKFLKQAEAEANLAEAERVRLLQKHGTEGPPGTWNVNLLAENGQRFLAEWIPYGDTDIDVPCLKLQSADLDSLSLSLNEENALGFLVEDDPAKRGDCGCAGAQS